MIWGQSWLLTSILFFMIFKFILQFSISTSSTLGFPNHLIRFHGFRFPSYIFFQFSLQAPLIFYCIDFYWKSWKSQRSLEIMKNLSLILEFSIFQALDFSWVPSKNFRGKLLVRHFRGRSSCATNQSRQIRKLFSSPLNPRNSNSFKKFAFSSKLSLHCRKFNLFEFQFRRKCKLFGNSNLDFLDIRKVCITLDFIQKVCIFLEFESASRKFI